MKLVQFVVNSFLKTSIDTVLFAQVLFCISNMMLASTDVVRDVTEFANFVSKNAIKSCTYLEHADSVGVAKANLLTKSGTGFMQLIVVRSKGQTTILNFISRSNRACTT